MVMARRRRSPAEVNDVPAEVQRWNVHYVEALCPFCGEIETHTGVNYPKDTFYDRRQFRASCSTPPRPRVYWLKFPFCVETNSSNYWIDRKQGCYVRNGAVDSIPTLTKVHDDYAVAGISDAFADMRLGNTPRRFTDATEELESFEKADDKHDSRVVKTKRIDHVLESSQVHGQKDPHANLLDSKCGSSEKELATHGVDADGSTFLSLAACCAPPEVLQLLLLHGSEVNSRNSRGRTPLMEAALWGQLENLQLLLDKGADAQQRDNHGRRAIDLAGLEYANEEERVRRCGGLYLPAREDPLAFRARRAIVALLSHKNDSSHSADSAERNEQIAFKPDALNQTLGLEITPPSQVVWAFNFSNTKKTAASLCPDNDFGWTHALSGWSSLDLNNQSDVGISTDETLCISEKLGFTFPAWLEKDQDPDIPGRFQASHAEAKLMAHFVETHIVYEDPLLQGPGHFARIKPPVGPPRGVRIWVSRQPCCVCVKFRKHIADSYGVHISFPEWD